MDAVVVRNRWWMRFLLPPVAAVFAVGGWYAMGALLLDGSGDVSLGYRLGITALLIVPTLAATIAMVIGPGLKETFTPTAILARGFVRTRSIELATASRIRQVKAAVRTGQAVVPVGRLQITGDRSHGAPMNAILDPTLTNFPAAMAILDDWVRQRPELVADDPTARAIFADRGVLRPS